MRRGSSASSCWNWRAARQATTPSRVSDAACDAGARSTQSSTIFQNGRSSDPSLSQGTAKARQAARHSLGKTTPVSWPAIHAQFGAGFKAIRQMKPVFVEALNLALAVYPEARVYIQANALMRLDAMQHLPRLFFTELGLVRRELGLAADPSAAAAGLVSLRRAFSASHAATSATTEFPPQRAGADSLTSRGASSGRRLRPSPQGESRSARTTAPHRSAPVRRPARRPRQSCR